MAAESLDALIVTSLPNILYLTNFTGSSAIVVITRDRFHFVTDFRYVTTVKEAAAGPCACPDLALTVVEGSYDATLAALIESLGSARVGFEGAHLAVARHTWLTAKLTPAAAAPALIATEGIVERLRVRKDAYELETLRRAAELLSQVAQGVFDEVRRGRSERDLAMAIDWRIRRGGFDRTAFETIVASGPNAALPHAQPGERILTEGDLVVLDFGGTYDSYCVDLTRTVSVGPAGSRAREVYLAVLDAHDRAIAAVAPGRTRFAIDAAARDTLAGYGLAEAFGHSTGHGLGLEVHEEPRVARQRSDDTPSPADEIAEGMVFTIEPGAYLPGWGGVRIEDDVLVTSDGVAVLTEVTTQLLEL
jgi:Xaa-Pro aminopeptidase